jgi:hypothetical protein
LSFIWSALLVRYFAYGKISVAEPSPPTKKHPSSSNYSNTSFGRSGVRERNFAGGLDAIDAKKSEESRVFMNTLKLRDRTTKIAPINRGDDVAQTTLRSIWQGFLDDYRTFVSVG